MSGNFNIIFVVLCLAIGIYFFIQAHSDKCKHLPKGVVLQNLTFGFACILFSFVIYFSFLNIITFILISSLFYLGIYFFRTFR